MTISLPLFWLLVGFAVIGILAMLSAVSEFIWFGFVVRRYKRGAIKRIDDVFREYQA